MTDDDDGRWDGVDLPPALQFTEENVRRTLAASEADIAAGRLIPVEDVLSEMRARQQARLAARVAAAE